MILAPVHRSFADFGFTAFCTKRKLFFMAKDSLWENKWLGRLLLYVGAFPVHRESADREALQRAEEVLRRGQCLVLFPEGTRREGPAIENLMEGAAFLSARTGAPIVPIGIGGSDLSMPKGSAIPKPYTIAVVDRPRPARRRPAPGAGGSPARPSTPAPRSWPGSCRRSTTRPRPRPGATDQVLRGDPPNFFVSDPNRRVEPGQRPGEDGQRRSGVLILLLLLVVLVLVGASLRSTFCGSPR